MYGKKQRIISFLMAFLLIFTFAFINPLTVSKSDAFTFAVPVLTQTMGRIITGVLVSAGFIIHEGTTSSSEFDVALMDISNVIYQTLDNAHKTLLGSISILDNVVEIPQSLYNSIVNGAKKVIIPDTIESLSDQALTTKYFILEAPDVLYPKLSVPVYCRSWEGAITDTMTEAGIFTTRKIDLREAQPYFIYEGTGSSANKWELEGIKYFWNDFSNDNLPVAEIEGLDAIFLTPDLSPYNICEGNSNPIKYQVMYNNPTEVTFEWQIQKSNGYDYISFFRLQAENISNINNYIIYSYFIYKSSDVRKLKTVTDIYNKQTGEFELQVITDVNNYSINYGLMNKIYDQPFSYDLDLVPSETITPPVINTVGNNVITLPNELSGTIGATSTDVNVGSTDVPDTPNTETMENINTNVGELVTGGTLGEQVNTNIGTVEGLHGELTEQVDFGAIFDTIAQYISSLDISSVTWFPTAVASFLVPFLPVISLGLILFFIDRVLNGGA